MNLIAVFVYVLLAMTTKIMATIVHEAELGSLAVIPCPSSESPQYRFMYWEVGENLVIGPQNKYDENKYHYEVWSGRLYIRSVSSNEEGIYKCISKHVAKENNAGLNIQAVELIVKRDWEEVFEEDPKANAYRAVIAVLVLFILGLLGAFAYFVRAKRTRAFVDMPRESSPEEAPAGRITQKPYNPTTTTDLPSTSRSSRALDNAIVETDIKSSFSLAEYP